jgi:hypothetical protein
MGNCFSGGGDDAKRNAEIENQIKRDKKRSSMEVKMLLLGIIAVLLLLF